MGRSGRATQIRCSCANNMAMIAESNRVCAKCANKIRNASELMRYLKSGFLAPQEHSIAMTCLPIAAEIEICDRPARFPLYVNVDSDLCL